ncbi:uncharacterized protein LOC131938847 [Physella acuta]|uniref:uncharacterized protein LOC131938847 n=1 Tax=Physella acuta TaxID=109671 RepID=UPI0027DD3A92|nr:uncharacterized protein LOC131938847 [Physella acuta]
MDLVKLAPNFNPLLAGSSSIFGDYFVFQLPHLSASGLATAHVYTPYFRVLSVTQVLTFTPRRSSETRHVTRNWATHFNIPVGLLPSIGGLSGAIVYTSDGLFGVDVILADRDHGSGALQVAPVSAFGVEYHAVTLGENPMVLIISSQLTTVTVVIRNGLPRLFRFTYQRRDYTHGDTFQITMQREQVFSLQHCTTEEKNLGTLTDSHILSTRPIGLIAGSCWSRLEEVISCVKKQKEPDIAVEMLLPTSSYGKTFLIPSVDVIELRYYGVVVTSQRSTVIRFYEGVFGKFYLQTIAESGSSRTVSLKVPQLLTSNKPIVCYLFVEASCDVQVGGPSMTLVVPAELFLNHYIWNTDDLVWKDMKFYVIIVIKATDRGYLRVSGEQIRTWRWRAMHGARLWTLATGQLRRDTYDATLDHGGSGFGCYLYGYREKNSIFKTNGYIVSDIHAKDCNSSLRPMTEGDYEDNDCDGRIDEEIDNNQDDDDDGRIDEDLCGVGEENGGWGHWEPWSCRSSCGSSNFYASRQCDSPAPRGTGQYCPGFRYKRGVGVCDTGIPCGQNCPPGHYGRDCSGDCSMCLTDCNHINGSCSVCKAGWQDPQDGCITPTVYPPPL